MCSGRVLSAANADSPWRCWRCARTTDELMRTSVFSSQPESFGSCDFALLGPAKFGNSGTRRHNDSAESSDERNTRFTAPCVHDLP